MPIKHSEDLSTVLNKAKTLTAQGDISLAFIQLKKWNAKNNTFLSIAMEADLLCRLRRYNRALVSAQKAYQIAGNSEEKALALSHKGAALTGLKDYKLAIEVLENSIKHNNAPSNAGAIYLLCTLYLKLVHLPKLEGLAPKLLALENYYIQTLLLLLRSALISQNKSLIIQRARQLSGHYHLLTTTEITHLIDQIIGLGELEFAESLLNKSLPSSPRPSWASFYDAKLAFYRRDYAKSESILTDDMVSQITSTLSNGAGVFQLRAFIHEKNGSFEQAFDNFLLMARYELEYYKDFTQKNIIPEFYRLALAKLPTFLNVSRLTPFTPIFMLGFPRSGTTLLDSILDSNKDVHVYSEVGALRAVENHIIGVLKKRYPLDLEKLSQDEVTQLREVYFEFLFNLNMQVDFHPRMLIIDKMPYYTTHIPLIKILFPNAKIIFSVRHPADVCLSCFQQNFVASNDNSFLVKLEDCFNRYVNVMELFEHYENELNLDIHFVRYEDLVAQPAQEMNKLSEFLLFQFSDEYKNFHKHAQRKVLNTSSKQQANQTLYLNSLYKWKNYQQYLAPYWHYIETYIEKFAYDE